MTNPYNQIPGDDAFVTVCGGNDGDGGIAVKDSKRPDLSAQAYSASEVDALRDYLINEWQSA